jgi:hypothetical protein
MLAWPPRWVKSDDGQYPTSGPEPSCSHQWPRRGSFQSSRLMSYCRPLYADAGVMAAPMAMRLLVWMNPEQCRL